MGITIAAPADPRWFAVMVKSRHEKWVAAALNGKGFTSYLPVCRKTHHYRTHNRSVELPLFPNYVFCRFNPLHRLPVLTIPGVFSIIQNSAGPIAIEDEEIKRIELVAKAGSDLLPWPYGEPGVGVCVVEGPLRGVTGFLVAYKARHRLVVSVDLLQRSVSMEVDEAMVRPLPVRRPAVGLGCKLVQAS